MTRLEEYITAETKSPIEWESKEGFDRMYPRLNALFCEFVERILDKRKTEPVRHVYLRANGEIEAVSVEDILESSLDFGITLNSKEGQT